MHLFAQNCSEFRAKEARFLRVAVNSFLELSTLSVRTIAELGGA
jgi:hypothetical protein